MTTIPPSEKQAQETGQILIGGFQNVAWLDKKSLRYPDDFATFKYFRQWLNISYWDSQLYCSIRITY